MARITFKNGDDYLFKISKLEASLKNKVLGPAIYEGAGLAIDEVRKQLMKIPTDESYGTELRPALGPRKVQKRDLYDSLGIASLQNDGGYLNVKIGFDGYNAVQTKSWPNGQPNQMVARSVERGTSWMQAHPFMKKAAAACRKAVRQAMGQSVEEAIAQIMNAKNKKGG